MSTWNSQEMSFKSFKIKDFYFLSILNNIRVGQKRSIITIIYTWKIYPMCLKLPPPPPRKIFFNLRGKSECTVFPKWGPTSFVFRWKILYTQFKKPLYTVYKDPEFQNPLIR